MKPVVRPLILEASVTEMRREVRSLRGAILVGSSPMAAVDYENGKEREQRNYYTRAEREGKGKTTLPWQDVQSEDSTIP
jgi:hypothetical protein